MRLSNSTASFTGNTQVLSKKNTSKGMLINTPFSIGVDGFTKQATQRVGAMNEEKQKKAAFIEGLKKNTHYIESPSDSGELEKKALLSLKNDLKFAQLYSPIQRTSFGAVPGSVKKYAIMFPLCDDSNFSEGNSTFRVEKDVETGNLTSVVDDPACEGVHTYFAFDKNNPNKGKCEYLIALKNENTPDNYYQMLFKKQKGGSYLILADQYGEQIVSEYDINKHVQNTEKALVGIGDDDFRFNSDDCTKHYEWMLFDDKQLKLGLQEADDLYKKQISKFYNDPYIKSVNQVGHLPMDQVHEALASHPTWFQAFKQGQQASNAHAQNIKPSEPPPEEPVKMNAELIPDPSLTSSIPDEAENIPDAEFKEVIEESVHPQTSQTKKELPQSPKPSSYNSSGGASSPPYTPPKASTSTATGSSSSAPRGASSSTQATANTIKTDPEKAVATEAKQAVTSEAKSWFELKPFLWVSAIGAGVTMGALWWNNRNKQPAANKKIQP